MKNNSQHIAVVGSGIAGLSAAYKLQCAGHKVTVIERNDHPGGRMAEVVEKGLRIRTGARLMYAFSRDLLSIIEQLNIEDELVASPHSEVEIDNGESRYKACLVPTLSLFKSNQLSVATKFNLARMLPDLFKARFTMDPNLMETALLFDDVSTTQYVSERVGVDFLESYIEPAFRAARCWNTENIARAFFLTVTAHSVGRPKYVLKSGIGYLTRTLAETLDVKLNAEVTSISLNKGRSAQICYRDLSGDKTIDCDLVVCAVQGARVREIIPAMEDWQHNFFDRVRYRSIGHVYYILANQIKDKAIFFTRKHPGTLSLFEQYPADPTRDGALPHLLAGVSPETVELAVQRGLQHDLDKIVRSDVEKLYPALNEEIVDHVNQWIQDMLPEFYPGYLHTMKAFLDRQDSEGQQIYFCGDYLSQALLGGASASGVNVATQICEHYS